MVLCLSRSGFSHASVTFLHALVGLPGSASLQGADCSKMHCSVSRDNQLPVRFGHREQPAGRLEGEVRAAAWGVLLLSLPRLHVLGGSNACQTEAAFSPQLPPGTPSLGLQVPPRDSRAHLLPLSSNLRNGTRFLFCSSLGCLLFLLCCL